MPIFELSCQNGCLFSKRCLFSWGANIRMLSSGSVLEGIGCNIFLAFQQPVIQSAIDCWLPTSAHEYIALRTNESIFIALPKFWFVSRVDSL